MFVGVHGLAVLQDGGNSRSVEKVHLPEKQALSFKNHAASPFGPEEALKRGREDVSPLQ